MSTEHYLETACRGLALRRGCFLLKLLPTLAGLPDRLLLCNGRAYFVELKQPRKYARPLQRYRHKQLRAAGFSVSVIRTLLEFKALLDKAGARPL